MVRKEVPNPPPFSGGMVEEYANYLEKICGNHWYAFQDEYFDKRMGAETFEAREKKIGGHTIVKNPNFPSRTSLKAYMKTSKGELRKIFGNPNYEGMTGEGSYNLVLGGKRVTIYDYRESGKRGMKYFNVGGDSWFAPIILAQIISAHRGEKVYAKEMSPQWLEDERRHEQVQSIDEHPDLTYEKAKRYHDYRYKSAETDLGFKEWADQEMKTHGKKESFDDWLDDELKSHGDDITLSDWGHHELDSHYERYGSEEEEIWEDEDYYNIEGEDYWDRVEGMYEDFCEDWEDNPDNDGQECPSMDEWVDTYGNFEAEGFRTMGGRGFQIEFKNGYTISIMFGIGSYGDHYNDPDFEDEDSKEYLESSQAEVAIRKPNGEIMGDIYGWVSPDFVAALIPVVATGDEAEMIEVIQNTDAREAEDMNWGGDPKGKLATALRNARIKAKQPKKPLKIEKLDAEFLYYYVLNEKGESPADFDTLEEAQAYVANSSEPLEIYERRSRDDEAYKMDKKMNAETSGQWEIGEQLEEAQMNAEGKREVCQDSHLDGIDFLEWSEEAEGPNCYITGLPNPEGDIEGEDNICEPCRSKWIYENGPKGEGYYRASVYYDAEDQNKDLLKWIEDYLWDNDKKGYQAYHAHRKSLGLNAEGKKRKKISGVMSDPFDELSLDSGGIKKGIVALAAVGLTIFGINKLRK